MKSQRISFLADILERVLSNEHQMMIANEYYSAKGLPIVYNNDEDGLAELCNGMSVNEILRASSYGEYSYTEPYVFINSYGNLETSDEICCNWRTIAEWMIDSGYKTDFLDEFPYHFKIDEKKVGEWFEYTDYLLSYLLLTSWHDLKENYDNWLEER